MTNRDLPKLLRAMAMARGTEHKHDVILNAAANELERFHNLLDRLVEEVIASGQSPTR